MIKDRVVPSMEIEIRYYTLQYIWTDITYIDTGKSTGTETKGLFQCVAYTYEEAESSLMYSLKEQAISKNYRFLNGNVKIVQYVHRTINNIFNEAYEIYGLPEVEEVEKPTTVLNEDKEV